ncbi:zinc finger, CCHC-type containing protein, partial [Tanacetum coccineum]
MSEEDQTANVAALSKFDMPSYESEMTAKDVKALTLRHNIPLDLHPVALTKGWTMDKLSDDMIGLYEQYFEFSGIRVPFSAFLLAVIKHFLVHISQLVPLGLNRLTMFELYYRSLNIVPSVNLFRTFSGLKGWKKRFFFLDMRAIPEPMAWRHHNSDVNDPVPEGGFNVSDVQTLTQQIMDLRPVPSGLLFHGGLTTTWEFSGFRPVFKDTKGNVITMSEYLRFLFLSSASISKGPALTPLDQVEVEDPKIVAIRKRKARAAAKKREKKKQGGDGEESSHPKTKRRKTVDPESREDRSPRDSLHDSADRSVHNYFDAHHDEETNTLRLGSSDDQSGKALTNVNTKVIQPSPTHQNAHRSPTVEKTATPLRTDPQDQFAESSIGVTMTTSVGNNSVFRSFFEKQKLTGPNFIDLYRQLRLVLSTEDKENYLEHPIPAAPVAPPGQQVPPAAAAAHAAWVKGQKEVAVLMLLTMDLDIQRNLAHLGAYDMLQELKAMFSKQAEHELLQTVREFYTCKQKEGQSVSSYVLKMKGYIGNLERLGQPVGQNLAVSLILVSLNKDFDSFVQNYNMHGMGKIVNELHALLKLHEETLPKKDANPALHAIRAGRVQKNQKNKPHKAAKGVMTPLPPKKDNPAKDAVCHQCGEIGHWKRNCPVYLAELMKKKKLSQGASTSGIFTIELYSFPSKSWIYDTDCGTHQGLRGSKKLKPGALSLYVGDGHRAAIEAIGTYHLELPSGLVIVLNNCHYAPSITRGVISVSRLFDDGFINRFDENNVISVLKNNLVYFMAVPRDGIFEIDMSCSNTNDSS